MTNEKFYKGAVIVAILTLMFTSYNYYKVNNPSQPSCNISVEYISATLQQWMKERVPDSFLKSNNLKVLSMDGFAEYKTIPYWTNIPLYEDFKHSTICRATALVDFSPLSSNTKDIANNDKKENLEKRKQVSEISVRYQLIEGSGIRMSGFDVEDMTKQVKEAINKYKKSNK